MNHSVKTRFLAMFLAVVMVIGYVPVSTFATENVDENAAPETVTVTFDVNGGVGEYEDQVLTIGAKVSKPDQDPTLESYEFAYWTADLKESTAWDFEEDVAAEDMTLYAAWAAPAAAANEGGDDEAAEGGDDEAAEGGDDEAAEGGDDEATEGGDDEAAEGGDDEAAEGGDDEAAEVTASYTVEHYLQTEDGYTVDESATETLEGIVDTETAAVAKPYDGFTVQEFKQEIILADGTTVIKIYYNADPMTIEENAEVFELGTFNGI